MKNLMEEGFDVTGFERSSRVGGLWQYEDGSKTTVLESEIPICQGGKATPTCEGIGSNTQCALRVGTVANVSKQRVGILHCFPSLLLIFIVQKVFWVTETYDMSFVTPIFRSMKVCRLYFVSSSHPCSRILIPDCFKTPIHTQPLAKWPDTSNDTRNISGCILTFGQIAMCERFPVLKSKTPGK